MTEWWSYSFEDFLLFSPRVYWRMFALHNEAVWPLHVPALLAGAVVVWWTARPGPWSGRAAAVVLAVAWAWVAWSFLWTRYATINWAAPWAAVAFALQALLLMWLGVFGRGMPRAVAPAVPRVIGWALLLHALLLHPLTGTLAGHPPAAAELFGIAPDPTAIATLGLAVLMNRAPMAWAVMALPLAWCAVSWATLHTMGGPEGAIPAIAALAAVTARLWPRDRRSDIARRTSGGD